MAVERRATCGHWYARFMVNGKRVCVALETPVVGKPGTEEYRKSLEAAKAEESRMKARPIRGDAAYHRAIAAALAGPEAAAAPVRRMNANKQPRSFRFANRLGQVLAERRMRQVELCKRAGINKPILNHYLNHLIDRPAPKFLRAICAAFNYDRNAVELVAEHLRDELERAGFRPKDFDISHDGIHTILSPHLITLAEAAARSPGWAATIKELAGMAALDAGREAVSPADAS